MNITDLLREIRENYPDADRTEVQAFRIEARPYNAQHGRAISTRIMEGPNEEAQEKARLELGTETANTEDVA